MDSETTMNERAFAVLAAGWDAPIEQSGVVPNIRRTARRPEFASVEWHQVSDMLIYTTPRNDVPGGLVVLRFGPNLMPDPDILQMREWLVKAAQE